MRRFSTFLLLGFCFTLVTLSFPPRASAQSDQPDFIVKAHGVFEDDFIKGRVMIRVKEAYRSYCTENAIHVPHIDPILDQLQVYNIKRAFPHSPRPQGTHNQYGERLTDLSLIYELDYGSGAPMEQALQMFASNPAFEYAEPSYIPQLMYMPNDPDTALQYYNALLRTYQAWDLSKGDTSVVIAITDLGTSFLHPDLINKHYTNWGDPVDGIDNDNDGYIDNNRGWDFGGNYFGSPGDNNPQWCCGGVDVHGVTVSGPAAAEPDNGNCIAGVGFNCRLMPLKISVNNLSVPFFGYQAVVYAADHGAHVINMSWGGGRSRFGEDAINYAVVNKGSLCVAAGGNTPVNQVIYPASFRNCMAVMGSAEGDLFWKDSPSFGSSYSYLADVCAPSRNIQTTWDDASCLSGTGTSVGAPMACGIAGLVKAVHDSLNMRQVGQKVRMGSDPSIYALNPGLYTEKMGHGRVNAYDAIVSTTPAIRIADLWLEEDDDDDEEIQIGDTVWVHTRFINWLSPVNDVTISMTTPTTSKVNISYGSLYAGDMGTLDTVSNWLAPFRFVVTAAAIAGERLYLRFNYAGTGYTDYEYIEFTIQPSYVNVDQNIMETSINGAGLWAYMNYPTSSIGRGLDQEDYGMYVQEGGFMIGNSPTNVSNSVRNTGGSVDADFTSLATVNRSVPGNFADLEATAKFNDDAAGGVKLGVVIDETVYQWTDSLADDYIIFEYKIVNSSSTTPLTNVYAGHYIDWWMWNSYANHTRYDSASKMTYAWDNYHVNPRWLGLALLTEQDPHPFAAQDSLLIDFDFSMAAKWDALQADPAAINYYNTEVVGMMSGGPMTIAPLDTQIVAFALVGSDNDTTVGLINATNRAFQRYWCVVRGGMTNVDLGADVWHCHGEGGITLDAGAGYTSYLWNTGATTPTIAVSGSGTYSCLVTDGTGCQDIDYVDVSIGDINGSFTITPSTIFVGDTISFDDTTPGSTERGWYFNDGINEYPVLDPSAHVFTTYGTYNICMVVGNGDCVDTVCQTVVVDTVLGTDELAFGPILPAELLIYPVPSADEVTMTFTNPFTGLVEIRILNVLGQQMYRFGKFKSEGALSVKMPVSQLGKGVYVVEVKAGDITRKARLVVD